MKLYLSSYKLGNNPERLLEMATINKKIAVIPNSLDFSKDIPRRNQSIKENIDSLNALGLEAEEVDLRNYFGKEAELRKKLEEFGSVFVRGGNTFVLRVAMKESGFDNIIKSYLDREDKKDFVYSGYSAGICVISPTLRGLDLVDKPEEVQVAYPNKEVIWEGLGLIDYIIAPHYKSDHHESEMVDKTVEYYEKNGMKYVALRDGEVLIDKFKTK